MARRDEGASGITQRTRVLQDVWVDDAGNVVDQAGNVVISAAAQSLVSGGGIAGVVADFSVDCIASGLALPTTGGLSNTVTSGVAYLQGARTLFSGQAVTLAASSDNYIDALPTGLLQVSSVGNGAGAPAVAVNGLRLGYVVTGASTVSSATTTGKDSLGNWMGNRSPRPSCILGGLTNQSAGAGANVPITFGSPSTITPYSGNASAEILDNLGAHSNSTNSNRISVIKTGPYRVGAQVALGASAGATTFAIRKNSNVTAGLPTASVTPSAAQTISVSGTVYLTAGDFIFAQINSAAGTALTEVQLYMEWAG